MFDLHSTTQVVSRLHATVLGKSCVVYIGLYRNPQKYENLVLILTLQGTTKNSLSSGFETDLAFERTGIASEIYPMLVQDFRGV